MRMFRYAKGSGRSVVVEEMAILHLVHGERTA
jgi:hypothetical protein